ncbi:MAG: hypothetical protein JJU40_01260 [Rhodobacteraceae bacterium]|nr:hypothetical protein [Paracoccaceae bacterium]
MPSEVPGRGRAGPSGRVAVLGLVAIVAILALTGAALLLALPDAGAFNAKVARLFAESEGLTGPGEIRLLEILAQSGTAFSEVLASYRVVIFVLLVFAAALLVASLAFLLVLLAQARRLAEMERAGIQIARLSLDRQARRVRINDMEFDLTEAAIETLAVLCEARLDDDILSGAEIEAVVSGRDASECDEAAGATRIKRLRDALGNQIVAELLVRNVARKGYVLAVDKAALRID